MCITQFDLGHRLVCFFDHSEVWFVKYSIASRSTQPYAVVQSVSLSTALLHTPRRSVISPDVRGRSKSRCVSTLMGLIPLFTEDVWPRTTVWSTFW